MPALQTVSSSVFLGLDLVTPPGELPPAFSPHCPNLVRTAPGRVGKALGYRLEDTWRRESGEPLAVNGVHGGVGEALLMHAGDALWWVQGAEKRLLRQGLPNSRSRSWLVPRGEESVLVLATGEELLAWDGTVLEPLGARAYVPLVRAACTPEGLGADIEPFNLLGGGFEQRFAGNGVSQLFRLAAAPLRGAVRVWVREGGVWEERQEGEAFTANRQQGTLSFRAPPPLPEAPGEDNVRVAAARENGLWEARLAHCTAGALFGAGPMPDRLFLGGCTLPGWQGADFVSASGNPAYFPETGWALPAGPAARILGYAAFENCLAAYLGPGPEGLAAVLRQAVEAAGETAFPVCGRVRGPAAVSRFGFASLAGEALYVAEDGVYALAPTAAARPAVQLRSGRITPALLAEGEALSDSLLFAWDGFAWLVAGERAFLLDGLQPLAPGRGEPWSNRGYACFARTRFPARTVWQQGGRLYFGTARGEVFRLAQRGEEDAFLENGSPLSAVWETPCLAAATPLTEANFARGAAWLRAGPGASLTVRASAGEGWRTAARPRARARFAWGSLSLAAFSWQNSRSLRLALFAPGVGRALGLSLRFENAAPGEDFALAAWAVEMEVGPRARPV